MGGGGGAKFALASYEATFLANRLAAPDCPVRELLFGSVQMRDQHLQHICNMKNSTRRGLSQNKSVVKFIVSNNKITVVDPVAEMLSQNRTVQILDYRGNSGIKKDGRRKVGDVWVQNQAVESFNGLGIHDSKLVIDSVSYDYTKFYDNRAPRFGCSSAEVKDCDFVAGEGGEAWVIITNGLPKMPNMTELRFNATNKFPSGGGDQVGDVLNKSSKLAKLWLGGKSNRMVNTGGLNNAVQRSCHKRLNLLNDMTGQKGQTSMAKYDGWGWGGRRDGQYAYEMTFIIEYVKMSSLDILADSSAQDPQDLKMILDCKSGFTVTTGGGWFGGVGDKFVPMLAGQSTAHDHGLHRPRRQPSGPCRGQRRREQRHHGLARARDGQLNGPRTSNKL